MTRAPLFLEAIQDTYPDLDQWQMRALRVEQPERGSDLFEDDKIVGTMRVSQMVRLSLVSSAEHLRVVRDTLEARNLYPMAVQTVLRGALVGACQALWVLHPDHRTDRQERGLMVIETMIEESLKAMRMRTLVPREPQVAGDVEAQIAYLEDRLSKVRAVRRTRAALQQTNYIADAMQAAFPTDPGLQDAGNLWWRRLSSDAHALGWSLLQRSSISHVDNRNGQATFRGAGTLEDTANPYMAAYRVLKIGWSWFDRRCESP